jgi:hypothetical protein
VQADDLTKRVHGASSPATDLVNVIHCFRFISLLHYLALFTILVSFRGYSHPWTCVIANGADIIIDSLS